MKRIKAILQCAILLIMLNINLGGCGGPEMTADRLVEEIRKASQANPITGKTLDVEFRGSYDTELEGASLSMGVSLSMSLQEFIGQEPYESYAKGSFSVDVLDQNYEYSKVAYCLEESGCIVSYEYHGLSDEWSKDESGMDPVYYYQNYHSEAAYLNPKFQNLTLKEETINLNGVEVYALLTECDAVDLAKLLEYFGYLEELELDTSLQNLKGIQIPVTYYINTETYLPEKIEADSESLNNVMKIFLENRLNNTETEGVEENVTASISESSFVMHGFQYDSQSIPELPDAARDSFSILNVLEFAGGHLANGSYLLFSGSKAAGFDSSILEGYKVIEYIAEKRITLRSGDETKTICCEAMSAAAAHQYFENTEEVLKDVLKEFGLTQSSDWSTSTVQTHLGNAEVYCMRNTSGLVVFNAVIETENISVCISALDTAGEWYDAEPVIIPISNAISEITVDSLNFMGYGRKADFFGEQMIEMMREASTGKNVVQAEISFSNEGIYVERKKGAKVIQSKGALLTDEVLTKEFLEYNDSVFVGLFNGKDMYSLTVRYPGTLFKDVIAFCSSVLLESDVSPWISKLDDVNVIAYYIVDPDTNLPITIMYDISEINTLLQTDKQYLVVDRITFGH